MVKIIPQIKTIAKYRTVKILFSNTKKVDLISSALSSVEYDKSKQELTVDFNKGTTYKYSEVSPSEFYELIASGSAGQYFVKEIRNNHEFQKVTHKQKGENINGNN